jgi:hypothetical protein
MLRSVAASIAVGASGFEASDRDCDKAIALFPLPPKISAHHDESWRSHQPASRGKVVSTQVGCGRNLIGKHSGSAPAPASLFWRNWCEHRIALARPIRPACNCMPDAQALGFSGEPEPCNGGRTAKQAATAMRLSSRRCAGSCLICFLRIPRCS